jgi:hypothetical protein
MFCGGQNGVRRARAHRGHEVNNYVTVGNHRLPTTTECRYPALEPYTSTPHNSTTTTAMNAAIEAMEREGEGEGEEIGYVGFAKKYGVDESTLRRRHQGKCTRCAEAAQIRQKLNPK